MDRKMANKNQVHDENILCIQDNQGSKNVPKWEPILKFNWTMNQETRKKQRNTIQTKLNRSQP